MRVTSHHRRAEARFRALIAASGLPEPDAVEYQAGSVLFLWHGPRVAVYVDFDDPDDLGVDELEAAVISGLPLDDWPRAA